MHPQVLVPKRTWERRGPLYLPRYDRHTERERPPLHPHRKRSIPHPQALITFGGARGDGGTQNTVTTTGIDTTGASLIVLLASTYQGGAADSISDSKSCTWVGLGTSTSTSPRVRLYYANASTGTFTVGSGHTFTNNTTSGFPSLVAIYFLGATTSAPYDTPNESGTTGASALTISPGALTASANNYVYVTGMGNDPGLTSLAISAGFTIPANGTVAYSSGNHMGAGLAYFIQTTAASLNPAWSWSGSVNCAARMAIFKVSVSSVVGLEWKSPNANSFEPTNYVIL